MDEKFLSTGISGVDRVGFDAGLRAHMLRVYNYMAGGLALSGLVAYIVSHTALAAMIWQSPVRWLVVMAPLVFVMFMSFKMQTISSAGLKMLFWSFCSAMGLSLSLVFLVYTDASVARTFFITAANFGVMSLWGYTSKRDLSGMGAFLMMGVIGLLIAMVVNLFLASSMMNWIVSIMGVVIFTGLTAYDTQRIKQTYAENWGTETNDKLAVFGALSLYLNFINAFQFLLSLTGNRR